MLVSKLWQELVRQVGQGRITEEHIKALLDDPDTLLNNNFWKEELFYQAPKGTYIEEVHFVNGKWLIVFVCGQEYFIRYNNEEFGPYTSVGYVRWVHDRLFYLADKDSKHWIIWGAEIIGPEECIYETQFDAEGKILYAAEREAGKYVVVWGGEVIAESDNEISGAVYCNNAPLFIVRREDGDYVIWHEVAEYGPYSKAIYDLQDWHGQPYYIAKDRQGGLEVILGNHVIGAFNKELPELLSMTEYGLLYSISDKQGHRVYRGNTCTNVQAAPVKIWIKDGKLLYLTQDENGYVLVCDDREYTQISVLHEPEVVQGKLLGVFSHQDRDWVSWGDQSSRRYDKIYQPVVNESGIFFMGRIGPRLFIASLKP